MNLQSKLGASLLVLGVALTTNVIAMHEDENIEHNKGLLIAAKKDLKELSQITDTLVMVYPDHFEYNVETSQTNAFQNNIEGLDTKEKALKEFTDMVETLRENGIQVLTLKSKKTRRLMLFFQTIGF